MPNYLETSIKEKEEERQINKTKLLDGQESTLNKIKDVEKQKRNLWISVGIRKEILMNIKYIQKNQLLEQFVLLKQVVYLESLNLSTGKALTGNHDKEEFFGDILTNVVEGDKEIMVENGVENEVVTAIRDTVKHLLELKDRLVENKANLELILNNMLDNEMVSDELKKKINDYLTSDDSRTNLQEIYSELEHSMSKEYYEEFSVQNIQGCLSSSDVYTEDITSRNETVKKVMKDLDVPIDTRLSNHERNLFG